MLAVAGVSVAPTVGRLALGTSSPAGCVVAENNIAAVAPLPASTRRAQA